VQWVQDKEIKIQRGVRMKKEFKANMEHYYEQTIDLIETLEKSAPEYTKAFIEFVEQAEKAGALSAKVKQLISLALSITAYCLPCIACHVKGAIETGATRQEILEAGMVAGQMGGGPGIWLWRQNCSMVGKRQS